tara:strand:- start:10781 stop:11185 length:405 start_codon:yes stop_codon:yes gene_type:complete
MIDSTKRGEEVTNTYSEQVLQDLDVEIDYEEVERSVRQLSKAYNIDYDRLMDKDYRVKMSPQSAAILVTAQISELINMHTRVPQMKENRVRDSMLRSTHYEVVQSLTEYRELLIDCHLDDDKELQNERRKANTA